MQKDELFALFERVKTGTQNFRNIPTTILEMTPNTVLIFRLLLNKGQKQFCKLTRISKGQLYNMESSKAKKINKSDAKAYICAIKKELAKNKISKNSKKEIYENYKKFKEKSVLNTKRAREIRAMVKPENNVKKGFISVMKTTPQNEFELKIKEYLEKNDILFELHSLIKAKNKNVVVDFALPTSREPKIIIEVKQSKSENIKRQYDLLHGYAVMLDHKIRNVKLQNPNVKGVVILSSKNKPITELSPYIKAEFLDTDKVFVDSNLTDLPAYLKSKL